MNTRALGSWGEQAAADYLARAGCPVVVRNFRTRYGEVDLIVRCGETLVFVEVKTRRGTAAGTGREAVTPRKQRTIVSLALQYLQQQGLGEGTPLRFDVVEVGGDAAHPRITHIPDAFGAEGF